MFFAPCLQFSLVIRLKTGVACRNVALHALPKESIVAESTLILRRLHLTGCSEEIRGIEDPHMNYYGVHTKRDQ